MFPERKTAKKSPRKRIDIFPYACPGFADDRFLHENNIEIMEEFFDVMFEFSREAFVDIPDAHSKGSLNSSGFLGSKRKNIIVHIESVSGFSFFGKTFSCIFSYPYIYCTHRF